MREVALSTAMHPFPPVMLTVLPASTAAVARFNKALPFCEVRSIAKRVAATEHPGAEPPVVPERELMAMRARSVPMMVISLMVNPVADFTAKAGVAMRLKPRKPRAATENIFTILPPSVCIVLCRTRAVAQVHGWNAVCVDAPQCGIARTSQALCRSGCKWRFILAHADLLHVRAFAFCP